MVSLFQRILMVQMVQNKVYIHRILLEMVEVNCLKEQEWILFYIDLVTLVVVFLILDQILCHQELE